MKVALMQPYLFPYIGYFQLMAAVDLFVLYDDVQWIKGGWIHRNRILSRGEPKYLTFPIAPAPFPSRICDRRLGDSIPAFRAEATRLLADSYRGAPQLAAGLALFESCLVHAESERDFVAFAEHALRTCADFLGITTPMIRSSALPQTPGLSGQDRVLDIVQAAGGSVYINSIGGRALYDAPSFAARGIELQFLQAMPAPYPQFGEAFVPSLSIIDVVMFNSKARIKELLTACSMELGPALARAIENEP